MEGDPLTELKLTPRLARYSIRTPLISFVTIVDTPAEKTLDNVNICKRAILDMLREYNSRVQNTPTELMYVMDIQDVPMTPEISFLLKKFARLQAKRRVCDKELCAEISMELSPVIYMIDTLVAKNVSINIDMQGLCSYLDSKFRKHPLIQKLSDKMIRIEKYINGKRIQNPLPLVQQIKQALLERESSYDENGFSKTEDGVIEKLLAEFIPKNQIAQIARSISTKSDFSLMIEYFQELCKLVGADKKKRRVIIRAAMSRLIFSEFYLKSPLLDLQSTDISFNVEIIKKMTPDELKLLPELFPGDLFHTPLENVFSQIPVFEKGFEVLNILMFVIDPFMIAFYLTELTLIVRKWLIPDETKRGMKSFEEYFSAFFSIFVGDPTSNAKGISLLLKLCAPLFDSSSIFAHSTMTFIGTTEYVENFIIDNHSEDILTTKIQELRETKRRLFSSVTVHI